VVSRDSAVSPPSSRKSLLPPGHAALTAVFGPLTMRLYRAGQGGS